MKTNTFLILIVVYLLLFRKKPEPTTPDYTELKRLIDLNKADIVGINDRLYNLEKITNESPFA